MSIRIKMGASAQTNSETVSFSDLGVSEKEWYNMTKYEKDSLIQQYVDELNDQPYWVFESYEER